MYAKSVLQNILSLHGKIFGLNPPTPTEIPVWLPLKKIE